MPPIPGMWMSIKHDPGAAVRNEFDCGFTRLAFAGHDEILRGSHGGGGRTPETGLVVDNPNPHPLLHHLAR